MLPCTADSVKSEIILRVDRMSALSNDLVQKEFIAYPNTAVKNSKALAPQDAFLVNLSCGDRVTEELCAFAKKTIQRSVEKIASNLIINQQIIIRASFRSFCGEDLGCVLGSRLGSAISASAFPVDDGTQVIMYPQALIKQLNTEKVLEFSDSDIIAEFNSDQPFYFPESGSTIKPSEYDFEFVIIHEITHGLGFRSGLMSYGALFGRSTNYLAPLITGLLESTDPENDRFTGIQPIDVFDSFISSSAKNLKDLGKIMRRFGKQDATLTDIIRKYELSGDPFLASREAYAILTSSTCVFNTNSGLQVELYNPSQYVQGSSTSHLTMDKSETSDFLMIPALINGTTLESFMTQRSANSVYGPGIISIMETIGWPTKSSPKIANVVIAVEYNAMGSAVRSGILMSIAITGLTLLLS
jgi:hypothetical protein